MNEEEEWGTLEELLLACAVNRHGPDSWDDVSGELCRRTSDHRRRFTPPNCRRRYSDLRCRLGGDDVATELRKLRVQELRREVQKHDLSIELLKSKLKRLEEEREETDLSTEPEIKKPVDSSDSRSLNESNSTVNIKDEPGIKLVEPDETEPVRIAIKRRVRGRFEIESSSGEDEVPLAAKKIEIKSQPLIKFLAILRAHKNGSVFERRLPSQESERYAKMIRYHIDLQIVQRRLDKGFYLDSQRKFFRDLLLLFTNALIFFSNTSNEYLAAVELRKLVITQMLKTTPKPDPIKKQTDPVRAKQERAPSPLPIVVCRRRCLTGPKPGSHSIDKSTKEVEVKMNMKAPKLDMKTKESVIVKKPNIKENNNKKTPPVKELESSSTDETDDDDEELGGYKNSKDVGKRGKIGGGRREKGREAESSKFGKKGRPVKGPLAVASGGRGGKRGKESGAAAVAVDTGRTRKRPRR